MHTTQHGIQQINQCRQIAQQLIQQTQQSNQKYQQMLRNEQQNLQMIQQIIQHEQQAVQTIQQSLHAHESAIQQCQQIINVCNQMQTELTQTQGGTGIGFHSNQQPNPVFSSVNSFPKYQSHNFQ
ncbi:hypothetical protein [Bacillus sp. Marseille-P3661]|uniref:hypothetical protein n=1 Tax=Bacillus sp. Marseille-P3661 TaxID=1936234 RepID=UPI000C83030A|nr:hypothetical protein [Bacillus sp. Marseille-P3661]